MMRSRITYHDLVKMYYELNIPNDLGLAAHSMCHYLILKANALHFATQRFSIPNGEMAAKSALSERTMLNAREQLTKYRLMGKPLVEFEPGARGRSGIYVFHYDLIMNSYGIDANNVANNVTIAEEYQTNTGNRSAIDTRIDERDASYTNIHTNKQTTTTESSSSFDASLEEKPMSDTMLDVRNLKSLLHMKYGRQLGGEPSDGHCSEALGKFEFHSLEEAIERMPVALRREITKSNIINTLIKYASNPSWGRTIQSEPGTDLRGEKRDEAEAELARLEGEFALALADESEDWLPKKQAYLQQQFPKINHIRKLLGREPMPESVLEAIE